LFEHLLAEELSSSEMSAERGGLCVDVEQSLKEGFADSGPAGMIAAAAGCLDLVLRGVPVCTD